MRNKKRKHYPVYLVINRGIAGISQRTKKGSKLNESYPVFLMVKIYDGIVLEKFILRYYQRRFPPPPP